MEKKTKIIIGIGAALVAATGVYFAITKGWFKKKDEALSEETETNTSTPASTTSSTPAAVTIKKAAPKSPVFSGEPKKTPAPLPVTPAAKGKKTYVYASSDGVKVYKKGTSANPIGNIYNTYKKGAVIGIYTGQTSVRGMKWTTASDAGTPVIVAQSSTYTKVF